MLGHLAVAGALSLAFAVADGCDPGGDRFGGYNDYRKAGCWVTERSVQAIGATGCNYAINGAPSGYAGDAQANACLDVLPAGFPGHSSDQYRRACGKHGYTPNTWPAGTPD